MRTFPFFSTAFAGAASSGGDVIRPNEAEAEAEAAADAATRGEAAEAPPPRPRPPNGPESGRFIFRVSTSKVSDGSSIFMRGDFTSSLWPFAPGRGDAADPARGEGL